MNDEPRINFVRKPDCRFTLAPCGRLAAGPYAASFTGVDRGFAQFILLLLLISQAAPALRAQEAERFPFVIPWDDASRTATDVSSLNPTPAGANGFIVAARGHFYDNQGQRVRFIGVNIVGNANFPDKETAEKVAAHLHKLGVNLVRLHHMDAEFAHPNIFDLSYKDHLHLNADSLARLDYFVYQLKRHGVYVDINLHVAREFTASDGFPQTDQLRDFDKGVDFFEPRMIQLQKDYARDLLTHVNAYTHTRYVDEPAVAVIEINNENTLLGEAWGSKLDALPPYYHAELMQQWNSWLKTKYTTTIGLKQAWSAGDKPFGPNILQNADFSHGAERWTLEQNAPPAAAKLELPNNVKAPASVKGKVAHLQIITLGSQNWHLQFHQAGIDLPEGEPYTVSFWAKADHERNLPIYASTNQGDYHHIGLDSTVALTKEWKQFTIGFTASRTEKGHNRLTFILGDAAGTVDLAGMSLRPGVENPFPQGASLEAGNVPIPRPVATPAGQDWIAFLIAREGDYLRTMRDYVKNVLHAHAGVIGSQASYGGLGGALRETASDFTDMHAYWQHPSFPHKPWDSQDWTIGNTALVRDGVGYPFPYLARYRLAGKPFMVSEYNAAAPNEYRAEMLPTLAAFAAVQDWDGFILFDYCADRDAYRSEKINSYFSINSDPARLAFLPAAAMMFERLDVPLANEELRLHVSPSDVPGLMAKNGPEIAAEWDTAGIKSEEALTHRLSVSFVPGNKTNAGALPDQKGDPDHPPAKQGAISWQDQGTDRARFLADSPSSQVMVGYLGNQPNELDGWTVMMPDGKTVFAALTLSALDGKVIPQSRSLLLTAVAKVENQGMEWNAAHTSVGDHWGKGPTMATGVGAIINLRTSVSNISVYALDGSGKRVGKIVSKWHDGNLGFTISPADKTLWYEIDATGKR